MPTYVYKFVETGETIEVQQAFTDATLTEVAHPDSGEPMAVKKVFTPVGVTFKGSGFFKTDNRGSKSEASSSKSDSAGSKTSAADSSSTPDSSKSSASGTDGGTSEKKAEAKPAATTPSAPSGSSST